MTRFVVGDDRSQSTLFPERLDAILARTIQSGRSMCWSMSLTCPSSTLTAVEPEATGRPAYHPATLLKIFVYGYLNRVQSSRRLDRECQRNIELVCVSKCPTSEVNNLIRSPYRRSTQSVLSRAFRAGASSG
jgi:hypothetical protein